jgi:hypothetical protein
MVGSAGELTATVEDNTAVAGKNISSFGACIYVDGTASVTISANLINGQDSTSSTGIITGKDIPGGVPTGSMSNNIITYSQTGINMRAGDVSVTANKLYDILGTAILIYSPVTVQSNTIMQAQNGIDFQCTNSNNVSSNTLVAIHSVEITEVPASVTSTNAYFNVPTTRSVGGCE